MSQRSIHPNHLFALFFLCTGLFVLTFAACGAPGAGTPCTSANDCLGEEQCSNGTCQPACSNDGDCLSGQYCDKSSGACKAGAPPTRRTPPDASAPDTSAPDTSTPSEQPSEPPTTPDTAPPTERTQPPTERTPPLQCGNGKVEGSEECDGTNLNNKTCQTEGFTGGSLQCTNCQLDTSGCTQSGAKKQFGQACANADDCAQGLICIVAKSGDPKGYCTTECTDTNPCPSSPAGAGCILSTSSDKDICGWSCTPGNNDCPKELNCVVFGDGHICAGGAPATPATCGDNKIEGSESCDGTNLNNKTCQTEGFTGGSLKCTKCQLDTSGCTGPPSIPNFGKACTGGSCGAGLVCVNFGSGVGSYCTAYCSSSQPCPSSTPPASCSIQLQGGGNVCGWKTSSGAPPVCGNGVVDPGEECDKSAFGSTCKGLGYGGGSLKCNSQCLYDKSGCTGTSTCSLPAQSCTTGNCSQVVEFLPRNGAGYSARHYAKWSWAKRSTVAYVKFATAAVSCVFPNTKPLGLGDMSESNGGTPKETNGQLRHPQNTHVNGNDMDIAYYQVNTSNNYLRAVCTHHTNGQDQYHCVQKPHLLDARRSAFFLAKLLESNAVRVIGVDGKIGPLVSAAMTQLHTDGLISKYILDKFNAGTVTWEETDKGRGWYRFHHHHLHVSFR